MMVQHRWVQGFHLNSRSVLFGGQLLSWVDEDCTMIAYNECLSVANGDVCDYTTTGMDCVKFVQPTKQGDRLRFEYKIVHCGETSLTVKCRVISACKLKVFSCYTTLVCIERNGRKQLIAPFLTDALKDMKCDADWDFVESLRIARKMTPEPVDF